MRASVGGQAQPNGVMMRCGSRVALATRKKDGTVCVQTWQIRAKKGGKLSRFPLLRGIRSLFASLIVLWGVFRRSLNTLCFTFLTLGAFFGINLAGYWATETFLPPLLQQSLHHPHTETWVTVTKLILLLFSLLFFSLLPPIRRLLRYHGAEHQVIHTYESGKELTVANARTQSRIHPRCGTTIAVSVLFVSLAVLLLTPDSWEAWLQETVFVAALLLTVGLTYESMRYTETHRNRTARILLLPSAVAQRFTTKEPTDAELECAVAALRAVTESPIADLSVKTERKDCC